MFPALLAAALLAPASPPAAPARTATVMATFFARNTTRVESWRFFEPNAGGGDPHYTFIANRLLFGARHTGRRWEFQGAGQYVQFGNLPDRALGPGPLGTGGAYYDASQDTASRQLYLKYLNVKLKDLAPGLDLQAGRFGYTSGAEAFSGQPKIESVKRQRVDSRLIGEFEWSIYQRSFDGVRGDWRRGQYHLTGAWLRPTQGGFEEDANVHVPEVNVFLGALSAKPGAWLPHTDAQVFVYHYDDERDVGARPDNSGLSARRIEVAVTTFGGAAVSSWRAGGGEIDTLLWTAVQTGGWYGQEHGGWSLAAELGYQWTAARWKPWLRGGLNSSSGDDDPGDSSHGTFFQMLPTARRYSLSTVYTQMNLRDLFAQMMLRPSPALSVRLDLHRLALLDAADRWYFGSGITQRRGTGFGFGTRSSGGVNDFGTAFEGAADYVINPHWSVNGYAGWIRGGDVVRALFADSTLSFAYVENVLSW
jgi:hypothetical protein